MKRINIDGFGEGKDLGPNEYGCADAANILYTIGGFPAELQSVLPGKIIISNPLKLVLDRRPFI